MGDSMESISLNDGWSMGDGGIGKIDDDNMMALE